MDNTVLKKRLNTFKSAKGTLRKVSDDVVIDVLRAWENWQGTTVDLYRELGLSKMQLVTMIQKAKRLIKNGAFVESEFKEIRLENGHGDTPTTNPCQGPEIVWGDGKIIRFPEVSQLVAFLKLVA